MPYTFKILLVAGLLLILGQATQAQDFFKDYRAYVDNNLPKDYRKSRLLTLNITQQAFNLYEQQTHHSILTRDTVFMVDNYDIELGGATTVVWTRSYSFLFRKYPKQAITLGNNSQDYISGYKAEFRHWVETADTAAYSQYGKQPSWFDAPVVSFTTAIKLNRHWHFVTSGGYTNIIDKLDGK